MPILIDGNNLIGTIPYLDIKDPESQTKLISIIREYQLKKRNKIIIFFDGPPLDSSHIHKIAQKITIKYPKFQDCTADDEIKKQLDDYNDFRDVTVVTSDRELKKFAKNKNANIINSIEFYYTLKHYSKTSGTGVEKKQRINRELSSSEVDLWMKLFKD